MNAIKKDIEQTKTTQTKQKNKQIMKANKEKVKRQNKNMMDCEEIEVLKEMAV